MANPSMCGFPLPSASSPNEARPDEIVQLREFEDPQEYGRPDEEPGRTAAPLPLAGAADLGRLRLRRVVFGIR